VVLKIYLIFLSFEGEDYKLVFKIFYIHFLIIKNKHNLLNISLYTSVIY